MSTNPIDIVVTETGAAVATKSITDLGTAAREAAPAVEQLNTANRAGSASAAEVAAAHKAAAEAAKALRESEMAAREGAASLQEGLTGLKETLLALGLALGVKEWIELTDQFTTMTDRISQVTGSGKEMKETLDQLDEVAQNIHAPLEVVSGLFVAMEKNATNLNITAKDTKDIIETIGNSARISGKSMESTSSAIDAISRSFETGSFASRGWMTILHQSNELASEIAASFGLTTAAMGKALQDGSKTAAQVAEAMAAMHDKIAAQADKMRVTVASAWGDMTREIGVFYGKADQASGASDLLAEAIELLAKNAKIVIPIVEALAGAITAYIAVAGTAYALTLLAVSGWGLFAAGAVAAVVAIAEFGGSWTILGTGISVLGAIKGAATFAWNELKAGYAVLKDLVEHSQAARIALIGLAAGLGTFALATAALKFEGFIAGVLSLGPMLATLVIGVTAATLAFLAYVAAMDLAIIAQEGYKNGLQAGLDAAKTWNNTVTDSVQKFGTDFVGAMRAASAGLNETTKAGDDTKHKIEELNNSTDHVVKGFQDTGSAAKTMGDHVVGAFNTMVDRAGNWVGEMTSATGKVNSAFSSVSGPSGGGGGGGGGRGGGGGGGGGGSSYGGNAFGIDPSNMSASTPGGQLGKVNYDAALAAVTAINDLTSAEQRALTMMGGWAGAKLNPNGGPALIRQIFTAHPNDDARITDFMGDSWRFSSSGYKSDDAATKAVAFATGGSFEVGGSGGTDSQLVQFMATPGEKVNVQHNSADSPTDSQPGGNSRPINVHMTVNTPDAASFGRSQRQIATALSGRLADVGRYTGGR